MPTYTPNPGDGQITCRHCGGGLWHGAGHQYLHIIDGTFRIRCEDDQHDAEPLLT